MPPDQPLAACEQRPQAMAASADEVAAPSVFGWSAGRRRRPAMSRPVLADGLLKLMLILLAFFVFLHSRTEFAERRVTPILDSLALRFAAASPEDGYPEEMAFGGDPATRLRRRLLGHLPISAARVEVPGALLAFELGEALLFEAGGHEVARERLVLLHRVAAVLATEAPSPVPLLAVTTAWPDGDPARAGSRFVALREVLAGTPGATGHLLFGFGDVPAGRWRFVIRMGLPDAA